MMRTERANELRVGLQRAVFCLIFRVPAAADFIILGR